MIPWNWSVVQRTTDALTLILLCPLRRSVGVRRQRNAPQRSKPPLSVDYVRCGARLHISVTKIRCVFPLDRSVGRYMPLDPFNVSVKIRWSRRTAEAPAFAQRILTNKLNGSKSICRPTDLLGRRVSCNGSFQRIKLTSTDIKSTDIKFYAKKPSSFRDHWP